jgi:hypothetical protein
MSERQRVRRPNLSSQQVILSAKAIQSGVQCQAQRGNTTPGPWLRVAYGLMVYDKLVRYRYELCLLPGTDGTINLSVPR